MKKTPKRRKHNISIQRVFKSPGQPDRRQIVKWIDSALEDSHETYACVIRIVDEQESAALNAQYRHKQGPTNVLSFPFEWPEGLENAEFEEGVLLGDLVICAPVVEREAAEQQKTLPDHWAHMVVHGLLHLLGYDHIEENEAEEMETKEIAILNQLQIENPYLEVIHQ
ncbi:rRNA maturation RNase YbeY [Candidatus Methylomicrobium oryzae]|jgi:probable rRNA maturation factor|uniref:rRNA maturation RNase YbeY n=1 Tax=Candidatus Methylomicrobium oryzae TaxID=2802053 RepID=UPI0019227E11|nr:rRNA maturation RNase YbeY [Methylomicrobium sp. RS1]MBL1262900.1 rRNA maturation RNase YbeY [Methylomicrobium sp. RS1]